MALTSTLTSAQGQATGTTFDGQLTNNGVSETWNGIRGGDATARNNTGTVIRAYSTCNGPAFVDRWVDMRRGVMTFPNWSTAVPGNATLIKAELALYANASGDFQNDFGSAGAFVVGRPDALVAADDLQTTEWDDIIPQNSSVTVYASLAAGSITNDSYNTWTLDAAGRAYVTSDATTEFLLATSLDALDSGETQWAGNAALEGHFASADSGTAFQPLLVLTYTVPATQVNLGRPRRADGLAPAYERPPHSGRPRFSDPYHQQQLDYASLDVLHVTIQTDDGPESTVTANAGTIATDIGSSNTQLWYKEEGSGNTGWKSINLT